jgi:hypothetical protein
MERIIVSSNHLYILLQAVLRYADVITFDQYIKVKVENKILSFGDWDKSISVEAKTDYSAMIDKRKIYRLASIIKLIEDQPITISFQEGNYIEIYNLII